MEDMLDNIPNFSGTSEKLQKEASYDDTEFNNLHKRYGELKLRDIEQKAENRRLLKIIEETEKKRRLYQVEDDTEFNNLHKRYGELKLRDIEQKAENRRLLKIIEETEKKRRLYQVEGENRSKPISLRKSKISVMMSYSWTQQSMVDQIRDACLKQGLTMWMDIYDNYEPKGYLSGAIADAIEKAEIVLICISQDYEDSQYCKAEAEYAFQLKKIIIPLKMVDAYKATGWLGLLIAGKYYYNFSGKHPFREEMTKLITWFHRKFEINQGINQVPDTEDTVQNLQQPPPAHSVEVKKYEDYDWMRYVPDLEDLE